MPISHLKLGIALAIPLLNEWNNQFSSGLVSMYTVVYVLLTLSSQKSGTDRKLILDCLLYQLLPR